MNYLKIQEPVRPLLKEMEKILAAHAGSRVRLISALRDCTPVDKGKKIRATFFFLLNGIARNGRRREDDLPLLGASIEMLHLSSLVHDDIVDNSSRRRGAKTPNRHFGDYLSVLWGDFLFITAMRMLSRADYYSAIDMLSEASRQMIEGQILEFENNFNYGINLRTYYDIIRRKTSSLFAGIADLAAHLTDVPAHRVADFRCFGRDFGMIFQISDDLLDLFSENSGKERFQDLKEGKVTLPYILLLRAGGLPLVRDFARSSPEPLLARCRDLEIREQSLVIVDRFYRRCRRFLDSFQPSPCLDSLADLLDFVRHREF